MTDKRFNEDIDFFDRLRATLPDKSRERLDLMERIRAKYINCDRDLELLEHIDFVVETAVTRANPNEPASKRNRREGRALVLVGESGAGKTTALERAFRKHPAFPDYREPGCPLLSVDVPSPCNLNLLGRELLNALGYPIVGERNEKVVWAMARARLDLMGVRIIHFDEAHNVTAEANITEQERIRKTFKALLNNKVNPLCLIISGTHEIASFLESITENRRRGRFQQFLPLSTQDLGLMRDIVVRLAEFANLNVGWSDTDALLPRLSHAALHQMGTAIEIIHEAIDRALREDASVLTVEHFAQVYARRTGNAAPYNPFVAPNWSDIDCRRVLVREGPPGSIPKPPEPAPKRKSRSKARPSGRGY